MSVTHAPQGHAHRFHRRAWLIVLASLAVAMLALGSWVLLQGGAGSTPGEALVDEVIAAWNAGDREAIERLYAKDAVVSFGPDDPNAIVGRSAIKEAASGWTNTVTRVGSSTMLIDPPGGFTVPIEGADHHYVVTPTLIHDDPFVLVLDVRNGKVSTHMVFEPFEPLRF